VTTRRDILKGMAVGLTVPLLISGEKVAKLLPADAPAPAANDELWIAPKKTGVDYDGILAAIFIEAQHDEPGEKPETMWVTRPDGTVVMQYAFHPAMNFQWLAPYEHEMIVGPVNIACSCTSTILLAGPRGFDTKEWMQREVKV